MVLFADARKQKINLKNAFKIVSYVFHWSVTLSITYSNSFSPERKKIVLIMTFAFMA